LQSNSVIEEQDEDKADPRYNCAGPETPAPTDPRNNQAGNQRAKIWTQGNGKFHIVDNPWVPMEEEQILDLLAYTAEEAVDNAHSEVGRTAVDRR
jgi:hypothetical protein